MRWLCYVTLTLVFTMGLTLQPNAQAYNIEPIGHVAKNSGKVKIEILSQYKDALLGLSEFSHVLVFYWFNQNDSPEKRTILRVHPRGNKEIPLTGVFATRSPVRPNLIGLTVCKIKSIDDCIITVDDIDAFDGTPIINLKPYRPSVDCVPDASVPNWAKRIDKDKKH
ncbi:MAG: tRNA (N6-threonylcarbamoyladenosine(37)-N6)-methyltransferase TrmO [Deltaproteobacteria bacterium]|nr:tRNA (N6-threonylcarbamoyladenosine(37)-N6)-methyltransferase TrmO [Deltaproteobacteria bacterium]